MPNLIVKKPRKQTNSSIYDGLVSVETNGEQIAQLKGGSLVGEISLITDSDCHRNSRRTIAKPAFKKSHCDNQERLQDSCSDLTAPNAPFINAGYRSPLKSQPQPGIPPGIAPPGIPIPSIGAPGSPFLAPSSPPRVRRSEGSTFFS